MIRETERVTVAGAIETTNLTKRFGAFTAVEAVDLSVKKGEIYGFLGLNGAGKTTTIRMLLGLIRPSGGEVRIAGERLRSGGKGPWHLVGSLVEVPYSYPELTVRENLEIIRRLRRIADRTTVGRIAEELKLARYLDRKAGRLSLGNAQRLGLAKALLHRPEILILDEPANGLDPAGIVEIRDLLAGLSREHSVTVFVSSHILDEVARLASRIGIIHEGRLVREMDTAELRSMREKRLVVRTRDDGRAGEVLAREGFTVVPAEGGGLALSDEKALLAPDLVAALLVRENLAPTSLSERQHSLESVFLRAIGMGEDAHG
jgi:ABC-2 type transport system ATP-binding protein